MKLLKKFYKKCNFYFFSFFVTLWFSQNGVAHPLVEAAEAMNPEEVRRLLAIDPGAVNVRDYRGYTALHRAVQSGCLEIVNELISNNANLDIKTNEITPLCLAMMKEQRDIALVLIRARADVDAKDRTYGRTPLHFALIREDRDMALELIGARADLDERDRRSETPLHLAVTTKQRDIALALIRARADVNARAAKANTPLHLAVQVGDVEMVLLLLEAGADHQLINKLGNTPLRGALGQGRVPFPLNNIPVPLDNMDPMRAAQIRQYRENKQEIVEMLQNPDKLRGLRLKFESRRAIEQIRALPVDQQAAQCVITMTGLYVELFVERWLIAELNIFPSLRNLNEESAFRGEISGSRIVNGCLQHLQELVNNFDFANQDPEVLVTQLISNL